MDNLNYMVFLRDFIKSEIDVVGGADADYCNDSLNYIYHTLNLMTDKDLVESLMFILKDENIKTQVERYKQLLNYLEISIELETD